jgi:hypothetical protein
MSHSNATPLKTRKSIKNEDHVADMFSRTHSFCHTHFGKGNHIITFTNDKYSGQWIQARRGQSRIAHQVEKGSLKCCHPHSQTTLPVAFIQRKEL